MKKIVSILLAFTLLFSFALIALADETTAPDETANPLIDPIDNDDTNSDIQPYDTVGGEEKDYSHLEGTTLNVYNWGEYISDGGEGSLNINAAFEEKYGITVKYTNYDSNEDMYTKLSGGGVSYDIIIPSDYMIARLIAENKLQKLDYSNIPNYEYIMDDYKGLYFDPTDEYSVPYNVGMVGIIYNTTMVEGSPDSWSIMWDEKYSGQILQFDNPRDAFGTAQFLLGIDVNSAKTDDWNTVFEKLKEQKPFVKDYVMDEIYNKMEKGEAAIAPYYAGDYLSMYDNNEDLAFFYPKEGTNIFVDSMCIPTSAQNKEAAELYINFLLDPEIALENAEYLYYATPNSAVYENEEYSLRGNEYLYPEEDVMPKVQYFHDLPDDIRTLMNDKWNELGIAGGNSTAIYIALAVVAGAVIAYFVFSTIRKKKRG